MKTPVSAIGVERQIGQGSAFWMALPRLGAAELPDRFPG
jgi:hypothetical protein